MERLALLLTLLVALLHAQGFTGPPPSCLASVYADQSKLLAPNCSVANLACLCTSLPFQASLPAALRVACTGGAADVAVAEAFTAESCAAVGVNLATLNDTRSTSIVSTAQSTTAFLAVPTGYYAPPPNHTVALASPTAEVCWSLVLLGILPLVWQRAHFRRFI